MSEKKVPLVYGTAVPKFFKRSERLIDVIDPEHPTSQFVPVELYTGALEATVTRYREALEKARSNIVWLRDYASGFEVLQSVTRGWSAPAEVIAKSAELDALLAEIAALSPQPDA